MNSGPQRCLQRFPTHTHIHTHPIPLDFEHFNLYTEQFKSVCVCGSLWHY